MPLLSGCPLSPVKLNISNCLRLTPPGRPSSEAGRSRSKPERVNKVARHSEDGPHWAGLIFIFMYFGVKRPADDIEMSGEIRPVLISYKINFSEFINISRQ